MAMQIWLSENACIRSSRLDALMDYKLLFAANVRRQRNKQDLTQEQLAQKAGITSNYLSKVERGISSPTLDVIVKIADGLNVNPAELFDASELESFLYIYTDLD